MKQIITFFFLILFTSCSQLKTISNETKNKNICFQLIDIDSEKLVQNENPEFCEQRLYACSTFKVPLAVMGFNSKILVNETTPFKWDGKKRMLDQWNKDQTVKSWMTESVVWVSQEITPKLGLKAISSYLNDFNYGNQDFSGGLLKAWLSSTLKISPKEQLAFLIKMKKHRLKVTSEAIEKTINILPSEVISSSVKAKGKTGSGFSWEDPVSDSNHPYRVGWYIGFAEKNGKNYAFVTAFTDSAEKGKKNFGGREAKEIALDRLSKL